MAARKNKTAPKGRRAAPAAEVEAVEAVESGGMGLDDGIVLTTTLLLGVALALVLIARGAYA